MKLSQKDLSYVFGKPWQEEFTVGRALKAFNANGLEIDYQSKEHLVTESTRLVAHKKIQELINE